MFRHPVASPAPLPTLVTPFFPGSGIFPMWLCSAWTHAAETERILSRHIGRKSIDKDHGSAEHVNGPFDVAVTPPEFAVPVYSRDACMYAAAASDISHACVQSRCMHVYMTASRNSRGKHTEYRHSVGFRHKWGGRPCMARSAALTLGLELLRQLGHLASHGLSIFPVTASNAL